MSAFVQAHDGFHGSPYRVTEQDGKAAEVLIASGVTETELVRVYSAAIRNTTGWQCQRATSLQRLAKYWNEVAAEVEQFDAVNHKVPMDGRDTLKEWLGV